MPGSRSSYISLFKLLHQKLLTIQNFYYFLKYYLEKLPAWILVILIKNREITSLDIGDFYKELSKVDFEIAHNHHLSKFTRYLTNIFFERRLKH